MNELKEGIKAVVSGDVLDDAETLERCSKDASVFQVYPQLVVAPKNVADISALVKYVNENKASKLSLTPRSAGTDMSGGPLSDSIVLDMTKYFNRIGEVNDRFATAQPGMYYRDFEKETLKKNRLMPSYPASRELCTIGGIVGNNAGGEKTLSFGQTKEYVHSVKMVLRDGNEYLFEPLTKTELQHKLTLPGLEGDIYRQVFQLVDGNYDLIKNAQPKVHKNSAGYLLWDIWNRETQMFEIQKAITGSQGTLGIITEITFKTVEPKKQSQLLVIPLENFDHLPEIVTIVLTHKPESFECYDEQTLRLAIRFLPEIAARLKIKNFWKLLREFMPELKQVLFSKVPKMVLIAEFTGNSMHEVREAAKAAAADLDHLPIDHEIAKKKLDSKKYWVIRRESFSLLRTHLKEKHSAPFIDDTIVLPKHLPEFLPALDAMMKEYKLIYSIAGHIGDGNFHIFPLMDMRDPKTREIIPELSQRVFELVFKYGGSMAGEHNDGLVRTPFLEMMYGPEVCQLFARFKAIFDPDNIFNPGKKVHVEMNYAVDHILKK